MSAYVRPKVLPEGEITFRGRGQGVLTGSKLLLRVYPYCSQRNDRRAADMGICQWYAYVPSLHDAEPAKAA